MRIEWMAAGVSTGLVGLCLVPGCGGSTHDFNAAADAVAGGAGESSVGGSGNAGAPDQPGGSGSPAGGTPGAAEGGTASLGGEAPVARCGDGQRDSDEECDLGAANAAAAYGMGKCTDLCRNAPFCGDHKKNGTEVCDEGGTSVELGSCNPECSGYFEKKFIRATFNKYPAGGLGGIAGADAKCVLELGEGWKALLVGGGRRATTQPFLGDGAKDWVIRKYTYYYSYYADALIWRTDDVALLGVRDGNRVNVYADAFRGGGDYPWSGWQDDCTTFPDTSNPSRGTCAGWTSTTAEWGTFTLPDLTVGASESCGTSSFFLCVEQ